MATQISIINKVQRRLRESQTTSVATNEYSVLLADFLNDIVQELNEYDWLQLVENNIDVNLVAGTRDYVIPITNRAVLQFLVDQPAAYLFDDGSDETGAPMILMNSKLMNDCRQRDSETSTAEPEYFALIPSNTSDTVTLQIWPEPNTDRLMRIQFWTPQLDLAVDGTDNLTEVFLPEYPLYLGTLFLALNERGEELGEPGGIADLRYQKARSSAIYDDMITRMRTNEYEAYRD